MIMQRASASHPAGISALPTRPSSSAASGGLPPDYPDSPCTPWSSQPSQVSYDPSWFPIAMAHQPRLDVYGQDTTGLISALMGPAAPHATAAPGFAVAPGDNSTSALLSQFSQLQNRTPLNRKNAILASLHSSLPTHARSANGSINTLYKTELCCSWQQNGGCRYGNKCQFAHGPGELRTVQRHPKYKTELCRTFSANGSCPYGARCRFIHLPLLSHNSRTLPATAPGLNHYTALPHMEATLPVNGHDHIAQAHSVRDLQLLQGILAQHYMQGAVEGVPHPIAHLQGCDPVLDAIKQIFAENQVPSTHCRIDQDVVGQRLPVFQDLTEPERSPYLPQRFTI